MSWFNSITDTFKSVGSAAGETLEVVGGEVNAGIKSGLGGFLNDKIWGKPAPPPQAVESGENGTGGTVVGYVPTGAGTERGWGAGAGLPGWVIPVGAGVAAVAVIGVVVMAVRK